MKKVQVTFLVCDDVDIDPHDVALILMDSKYEFAHRGSEKIPARINAQAYVDARYPVGSYSHNFRAQKVLEVEERCRIAAYLILHKCEVK